MNLDNNRYRGVYNKTPDGLIDLDGSTMNKQRKLHQRIRSEKREQLNLKKREKSLPYLNPHSILNMLNLRVYFL